MTILNLRLILAFGMGQKTGPESLSISASLGSAEPKNWNNNCILSLPYKGEIYEYYRIKENRDRLKELFVDHWNPEMVMDDQNNWIAL